MPREIPMTHPGEVLREEFLKPYEMTVYALAQAIGVARTRLNDIVLERRGITADTALRLAKYFDTSPEFWIGLQNNYDLANCMDQIKDTLDHIHPRAA